MYDSEYIKMLNNIDSRIEKLKSVSTEIRNRYMNDNLIASYNAAMKLEQLSEELVLKTRVLPAYTGMRKAYDDVQSIISATFPIEMSFTDNNWFHLKIPALLPKKEKGSVEYIRAALFPAMQEFFENREVIRFDNATIIFKHIYDGNRPERKMRDHDNIEVNMVTDIVAFYVLRDDNPTFLSHYYCSSTGECDYTDVFVIPQSDFLKWLYLENTATPSNFEAL